MFPWEKVTGINNFDDFMSSNGIVELIPIVFEENEKLDGLNEYVTYGAPLNQHKFGVPLFQLELLYYFPKQTQHTLDQEWLNMNNYLMNDISLLKQLWIKSMPIISHPIKVEYSIYKQ